ncbi:MAG TPA: hypothetical protein VGR97_00515 [Candidatus Acidoferrales bacterium]|nr:hypothetical protein [Candidatus Acidoferrales bacterium]
MKNFEKHGLRQRFRLVSDVAYVVIAYHGSFTPWESCPTYRAQDGTATTKLLGVRKTATRARNR